LGLLKPLPEYIQIIDKNIEQSPMHSPRGFLLGAAKGCWILSESEERDGRFYQNPVK
jgi:hypothetical protein